MVCLESTFFRNLRKPAHFHAVQDILFSEDTLFRYRHLPLALLRALVGDLYFDRCDGYTEPIRE
jgi:hypothetical protein